MLSRLGILLGGCKMVALAPAGDGNNHGFRDLVVPGWSEMALNVRDGEVTNLGEILANQLRFVMIPPWGIRVPFRGQPRDSAVVALVQLAEQQRHAPVYALVPAGLVAGHQGREAREALWAKGNVEFVLECKAGDLRLTEIHPSLQLSLIALAASCEDAGTARTVTMLDGARLLATEERALKKPLQHLLSAHGKVNEYGYKFAWPSPAVPLLYERHHPRFAAATSEMEAQTPIHQLREVVERCFVGRPPMLNAVASAAAVPLIRGADLRMLGELAIEDV
jgi:hypothetical protein